MKAIHLKVDNGKVDAVIPGNAGDEGSLFVDKQGKIRWQHKELDTVGKFVVTFVDISTNLPVWPFTSGTSMQLEVEKGPPLDMELRSDAPAYLKYTVKFASPPGMPPQNIQPRDPMIIIRGKNSYNLKVASAAVGGVVAGAAITCLLLGSGVCF